MNFRQSLRNLRTRKRKTNNNDPIHAIVAGDSTGNYLDPVLRPGKVYVSGNRVTGWINGARTGLVVYPGLHVLVEYDEYGRYFIARVDGDAELNSGSDPNTTSQPPRQTLTQDSLETLRVVAGGDLIVNVKSWVAIVDNTGYQFLGNSIDIGTAGAGGSSLVPGPGEMCYAVIFVKSDYSTLEAFASTPRSISDMPLSLADWQECLDQKSSNSTPIWAIPLMDDQSEISQADIDLGVDLRNLVNNDQSSGSMSSFSVSADSGSPLTITNGDTLAIVGNGSNVTTEISGGQVVIDVEASGDVSGPGSSIVGDIAIWDNTSGTLLDDSGASISIDGTFAANSDALVPTQKATKSYIDAVATGLSPKQSVVAATTAALPTNTYSNGVSGVGATLTGVATGVLTIDGVTIALNDRVLINNEAAPSHNGIYKCTVAGAVGVAYVLTRTTDADTSAELIGAFVFVEAGTVNVSSGWVCTNSSTITIGTTAISFTQFSGAGEITAGAGLTKSGNTIDAVGTANRIVVNPDSIDIGTDVVTLNGSQTLANKILSQLVLLLGGFKATFLHAFTADHNVTIPGDADVTLVGVATSQTLTNKTLTAPTIGDFSNANHNHQGASGGGQLTDAALSAAVGVPKGGTGQTTLAAHALLVGNGTSGVNTLAPSTNRNVAISDGTDWASRALINSDIPLYRGNLIKNNGFDVWEVNTTTPPKNWILTGSGASVDQEASIVKTGSYSLKLTRSGTDCRAMQDMYETCGSNFIRDRQYTFGGWVYATVASRVRLRVDDGTTVTNSSYHSGGSSWEWLSVTVTVGSSASTLKVGLQVDTGNTSGYLDSCALVEGDGITSGLYPSILPFNEFPKRATMWGDEMIASAASWTTTIDAAQAYAYRQFNSPGTADGESATSTFWLKAGSYTLSLLTITNTNCGKVQVYIDGVANGSLQDLYSAAITRNVVKTVSITVKGDGYHLLQLLVNGKNASSSAFVFNVTKVWIAPSGEP